MRKRKVIRLNENLRYKLQDEAAVEDFVDGSLLFLCRQRKILELNQTARKALALMDGKRSLGQIIKILARNYRTNTKNVEEDVHRLVAELGTQGGIRPLVRVVLRKASKPDKSASLMANPKVSLRLKNERGAILFNSETNEYININPVGLLIWRFLEAHPRSQSDIAAQIKETCVAAPRRGLAADIERFINNLHGRGFIGEALNG